MKRVGIILTAVAFLFAFAAPLFAVEADWTGEFDFGGITGFDAEAGKIGYAYGNIYFDATLAIDDYNSVVFEVYGEGMANADGSSPSPYWGLGWAVLDTDLGAYMGLPVGLTTRAGYANLKTRKYEVTGHSWERSMAVMLAPTDGDDRAWIGNEAFFQVATDFDMAKLNVAWNMGKTDTGATPEINTDYAFLLELPEIGPASAEAGYFINDNADFTGLFAVNMQALGIADMVDFAAGFMYDTTDAAVPAYAYGVGLAASYNIAKLGVSFGGYEDSMFNALAIDLNVEQGDIGADIGTGLYLDSDVYTDTFGGIDTSVYYMPGASKWRLGYVYSNANNYYYNAPVLTDGPIGENGGLYLSCSIDI
jgi:hypothetical protein